MNVINFVASCIVAVFGGLKSPIKKNAISIDSYSTETLVKYDLTTSDNFIFYDYFSSEKINAYFYDNTSFLGVSSVQYSGLGAREYSILNWLDNQLTNYSDYWFGYLEYLNEYSSNGVLNTIFTRFYFVNSNVFPSSVYYVDDKTPSTFKEFLGSSASAWSQIFYSGWFDLITVFSTFNFTNSASNYWVDATSCFERFKVYNLKSQQASVEPQRHYGQTYVSNSGTGQVLTGDTACFLPFCYLLVSSSNLFSSNAIHNVFSTLPTHIYFELNKNPTGQDLYDAQQSGYNDGYQQGLIDGNDEGHADGYAEGFHDGELRGYDEGYTAGVNSPTYSFASLFGSIADTPVLIIRNLFDFDLFGVSALTVILSCFTALIVLYIFRKLV